MNAFVCNRYPRRWSFRRASVVLVLLAGFCWTAAPARAQAFFGEGQMLEAGSELSLTFSLDTTTTQSLDAVGLQIIDSESSAQEGVARYTIDFLRFGLGGQRREFREDTGVTLQDNDSKTSVGYLGLTIREIGFEGVSLALVSSRSSSTEHFFFNGFSQNLDIQIDQQGGAILQLWFLLLGSIRGNETIGLTIEDPGRPVVRETYTYDFEGDIYGIAFGDGESFGVSLIFLRKDTPPAQGTVVNLAEGFEESRQLSLGLGLFSIDASETRSRLHFVNEILTETVQKNFSLGFEVGEQLEVAISRAKINDSQQFIRFNTPSRVLTEQVQSLLTFRLLF